MSPPSSVRDCAAPPGTRGFHPSDTACVSGATAALTCVSELQSSKTEPSVASPRLASGKGELAAFSGSQQSNAGVSTQPGARRDLVRPSQRWSECSFSAPTRKRTAGSKMGTGEQRGPWRAMVGREKRWQRIKCRPGGGCDL